jgi:hypothetical protein
MLAFVDLLAHRFAGKAEWHRKNAVADPLQRSTLLAADQTATLA